MPCDVPGVHGLVGVRGQELADLAQRPERARLGSCVLGRAGGCTVISMAVIGVLARGRPSRFQML